MRPKKIVPKIEPELTEDEIRAKIKHFRQKQKENPEVADIIDNRQLKGLRAQLIAIKQKKNKEEIDKINYKIFRDRLLTTVEKRDKIIFELGNKNKQE